jgi:hypothetical protein
MPVFQGAGTASMHHCTLGVGLLKGLLIVYLETYANSVDKKPSDDVGEEAEHMGKDKDSKWMRNFSTYFSCCVKLEAK